MCTHVHKTYMVNETKKIAPNTVLWDTETPKMPLGSFCVGHLQPWVGPALLRVIYTVSETLLEKTKLFLCRQLSVWGCFWVRDGGLCPISSLSTEIPAPHSGPDLCKPCPCCQSLWTHICIHPALLRRPCFHGALHPLWLSQTLFIFSSAVFPKAWQRGIDGDIQFMSRVPRSQNSAHCSAAEQCYRKFLSWLLNKTLISEYSRMLLGLILLLCSFGRIVVFVFFFLNPCPI